MEKFVELEELLNEIRASYKEKSDMAENLTVENNGLKETNRRIMLITKI